MAGKVYLVGAGPGEGGLLTIKGLDLIKRADVIVYDRLVGEEVMEFIPEDKELINVGKNAGDHPVPQWRINEILLEEAEKGKMVVRLKGGDPFIFGRGGEELELLKEKGIDFEVVPGITSSIAVPAYAGVPVTHRDYCSSLHIITGHARAGGELSIDYDSLVKLNGTLIFMMSVASLPDISEGLLKAGMDPEMPCAIIENGTRSYQRKFIGKLSEIAEISRANHVISPSVILVGKVAELSDQFDWYGLKPLRHKKFIVTQPVNKSSRLAKGLRELGGEAVLYPCIETKALRPIDPPYEDYDTLVFTSSEGVKSFMDWLLSEGKDMRSLYGKKIACIGTATSDALKVYGIIADFVPTVYSGRVLGREMLNTGFIDKSSKVLLLRADISSKDVTDELEKAGIGYLDYIVYNTRILKNEPVEGSDDIIVTFTSRSCVTGFADSQGKTDFTGTKALAIGESTAEEARKYGFEVTVSEKATIQSMIEKACEMA
ncbi:MAG: uroporphyrinogen-III C-methyltransferase [Firmicutes bacterium]|nr:uroporphyrinogen-III C-methyltransferase [Bacillota bacterium]